jgi:type II secretory pathway component GspD/PulD (secretin)
MKSRWLLVCAFLGVGMCAGVLRLCADPVAQGKPILQRRGQESDEPNVEVIRLRYAKAVRVGQVLVEVFNGGGLGRIRAVPDPRTNSLLVIASASDMVKLRKLVDGSLDRAGNGSEELIRTWLIGPLKYARAGDVAAVIREVYRTSRPSLSLGVDRRTNSLVLACAAPEHQQVKQLVGELEAAAKDLQPRRVWVIGLRHAVAADLAKVLRAAYGDGEKSVGFAADARTNRLVVRCPPAMRAEISDLVGELDGKGNSK